MPFKDPVDYVTYLKEYRRTHPDTRIGKNKQRRKELKKYIENKKRGCHCARCLDTTWQLLEYHHSDPDAKKASVSQLVHDCYSERVIELEIAKCILICPNCHRKIHLGIISV